MRKLISRTADAGQARYTLPGPGLLNPDRSYFWRVRAQDNKGVWGTWSDTWSFVPRGPAPRSMSRSSSIRPTHAASSAGHPTPKVEARWLPYLCQRRKGILDQRSALRGHGGDLHKVPAEFPANFVIETTATEHEVVGTHVELAGANKAFYRVVAVDAAGKRSGPSDVVASIRPVVFSKPVTSASKGVKYRYPVAAIRSLGDLRTRVVGGKETMSFWDVERLRFKIDSGPAWLSIDESTGLLVGNARSHRALRGRDYRLAGTTRTAPG